MHKPLTMRQGNHCYSNRELSIDNLVATDHLRQGAMAAVAYGGLGLREDAIREGRLAVDLLPLSRDAYEEADWPTYIALIYAKVREYDEAIDQLDYVLSVPAFVSVNWLRADRHLSPAPRPRALPGAAGDVRVVGL